MDNVLRNNIPDGEWRLVGGPYNPLTFTTTDNKTYGFFRYYIWTQPEGVRKPTDVEATNNVQLYELIPVDENTIKEFKKNNPNIRKLCYNFMLGQTPVRISQVTDVFGIDFANKLWYNMTHNNRSSESMLCAIADDGVNVIFRD